MGIVPSIKAGLLSGQVALPLPASLSTTAGLPGGAAGAGGSAAGSPHDCTHLTCTPTSSVAREAPTASTARRSRPCHRGMGGGWRAWFRSNPLLDLDGVQLKAREQQAWPTFPNHAPSQTAAAAAGVAAAGAAAKAAPWAPARAAAPAEAAAGPSCRRCHEGRQLPLARRAGGWRRRSGGSGALPGPAAELTAALCTAAEPALCGLLEGAGAARRWAGGRVASAARRRSGEVYI